MNDLSQLALLLQAQQQSQNQGTLPTTQATLLNLLSGGQPQQPNNAAQQQPQQQQQSGSNTDSALIAALLQHQAQQKQREEHEKLLLLQKLSELSKPQAPTEDLALLWLQQQRQQQQLAASSLGGGTPGANNPFLASGNVAANLVASPQAATSQFDAATLARLLNAQQQVVAAPAPPTTTTAGFVSPTATTTGVTTNNPSGLEFGTTATTMQMPSGKRKGRTGTFPAKLHQMLSDLERQEGGSDIASFLPHGRAFAIHKPRDFVKHVMPKYFRMSRFSSFQRQLNLYDFQRITEGPEKNSYYHELFVQGRPILSTMMKRNKIKGIKKKNEGNNAEADANDGHEGDDAEEEEM